MFSTHTALKLARSSLPNEFDILVSIFFHHNWLFCIRRTRALGRGENFCVLDGDCAGITSESRGDEWKAFEDIEVGNECYRWSLPVSISPSNVNAFHRKLCNHLEQGKRRKLPSSASSLLNAVHLWYKSGSKQKLHRSLSRNIKKVSIILLNRLS